MNEPATPHAEAEVAAVASYGYFAGGRWLAADGERTFEVTEPYSGEVFARVAACNGADARRAVRAAADAFPDWAATGPAEKQALFLRAAEVVERRRSETVDALVRESGCTVSFANIHQDIVKAMLVQASHWAFQPRGEVLQSDVPGVYSTAVRRPLGVVASITPWNGGSVLAWRSVLSPLAAGNTVVVKPSEEAPVSSGLSVAQAIEEAGFPPGVVNVVGHAPGEAAPIADVFFDSPDVRCINFIGSVRTGRMLAERAGRSLKRSVMELGGYNPLIVLDDVDIDYAVRVAAFSAFYHQGQICLNARKALVQRKIYDEFLDRLIQRTKTLACGDPTAPETVIGPLINDRAAQSVRERVAEAVAKGARVAAGGGCTGRVHEPTILVDVPDDAVVSCEETFGPVLVVTPIDDPDEAIETVNRSPYGLTSAILSGDVHRGFELAGRIRSGSVHVNGPTFFDEVQSPVGGVRDSGWGRSGPRSLDDFSDLIWVTVQSGHRFIPM